MKFLPIAVDWTFDAGPTGRRMTLFVRPNEHEGFHVTFDPFPRGFSRGFIKACSKGESQRTEYLARIAYDRALRLCFERFGVNAESAGVR